MIHVDGSGGSGGSGTMTSLFDVTLNGKEPFSSTKNIFDKIPRS